MFGYPSAYLIIRTKLNDKGEILLASGEMGPDEEINIEESTKTGADDPLPKSLCNTVIRFIQDENISNNLKPLIQCHVNRADSRIFGMYFHYFFLSLIFVQLCP